MTKILLMMPLVLLLFSSQSRASSQPSQQNYPSPYINCSIDAKFSSTSPFGGRRIVYIPQPGPTPTQSSSCGIKQTSSGSIVDQDLVSAIRQSLIKEFGSANESRQEEIEESLEALNARFSSRQQTELKFQNAAE